MSTWTRSGRIPLAIAVALATALSLFVATAPAESSTSESFARVATFPVYLNSDIGNETVAEIVTATEDGQTLIYTDAELKALGFIDIADPANPQPGGHVALDGEPTSVAVKGGYAIVGINTSESFTEPSGLVVVLDIATRAVVATFDAGGQPDSVAVSPDGRYAAVAIENERDEDIEVEGVEGGLPQLPAGGLLVMHLDGAPAHWTTSTVDVTGFGYAPDDPEVEFVDINSRNQAVLTLQENNALVVVDLTRGVVIHGFDAGSVDLDQIDISEEIDLIELNGSLDDVVREPDAVAWIDDRRFATANEGDLFGGSRGWSIFSASGSVEYDSGNSFEHLAVSAGHYPDGRSENKGSEPEGIEVGHYGDGTYVFVGSERGNFVAIYEDRGPKHEPALTQVLPTNVGPEGLLAIPDRDLFVVASEVDEADEKIRSTVMIYELADQAPFYPDIVSADDGSGAPIPWGALSALASDRRDKNTVYSVNDSAYDQTFIYTIDVSSTPAVIVDSMGLTKDGEPVGYDGEGLVQKPGGGFWMASEGNADDRPNLLVEVAADGSVIQEVALPDETAALARSNGFEGVTMVGSRVVVAFQREWEGDPENHVRIGVYTPATDAWRFFYYPIDDPTSPLGGWVGLSEIVHVGGGTLAIIERDNQTGPDGVYKVVTTVNIRGIKPLPEGGDFPVLHKTEIYDLVAALNATNGWIGDKPEGLAVTRDGRVFMVVDNDAVDDATGETQFLELGHRSDLRSEK